MHDLWDPLLWGLRFMEIRLRFHGYRRRLMPLKGSRFGAYIRSGSGNAPPLVLLHGIALFAEWWNPLLRRLPREVPVSALELMGFSRSPGRELHPDDFTLELHCRQIRILKETLGWDRMILAGVSLGGWVCLKYALTNPDDVKGLILYAPSGVTMNVTEEGLEEMRRVFDYRTPEEFDSLINKFVLHRPRRIPRWVSRFAVRRSERNGHKHLLHNLQFPDWIGEGVKDIEVPTALIWGRQDKVFPFSAGEQAERIMPNARLFPMDDAGHSYMFERPGATCQAFFDALEWVTGKTDTVPFFNGA
jgi:pimeloyl-ACP methyl ester carboxylesterase